MFYDNKSHRKPPNNQIAHYFVGGGGFLTLRELLCQVLEVGRLLPLLSGQLVPQLVHSRLELAQVALQRRALLLQAPHLLLPQRLLLLEPPRLRDGGRRANQGRSHPPRDQ